MSTLSNYADTIKITIKSLKINLTNIFYMITINYIFKIQKENVMNKQAMFNLSYGLYILTAKDSQKDNGCIVNTVMQVTETPNQIIAAVNKLNYTHDLISKQESLMFPYYHRIQNSRHISTGDSKADAIRIN